jgi:ADP-heptose:LPS heptosyltransferase
VCSSDLSFHFDMAIDLVGDIRGLAFLLACNIPERISFIDFGGRPWCTRAYATPKNARHLMARWAYLVGRITGRDTDPCAVPLWPSLTKEITPAPGRSGSGRLVLVHPGTFNPEKQWPAERFAQVIERLMEQEALETCIIAGKGDAPAVDAIVSQLAAPCRVLFPTFYELEMLLKQARVLLCLDSFAQHAASALGTPAVVVYGPSMPRFFAPCTGSVAVVWNNCIVRRPYLECTGPRPVAANSSDTVFKAVVEMTEQYKE